MTNLGLSSLNRNFNNSVLNKEIEPLKQIEEEIKIENEIKEDINEANELKKEDLDNIRRDLNDINQDDVSDNDLEKNDDLYNLIILYFHSKKKYEYYKNLLLNEVGFNGFEN